MIPYLLPADTGADELHQSLGDGWLAETVSCTVKRVLNGIDELELTYPLKGRRASDLALSKLIIARPEYKKTVQPYRIYDITRASSGITVQAHHVKEQLSYIPVMPFTAAAVTASQAFEASRTYTGEDSTDFSFWTDITTKSIVQISEPVSMLQLLGGVEGSILDTYGGEYEFDGWQIKLYQRRGADNGVVLAYGKNIKSAKKDESIDGTITGICPFWAGSEGVLVTLPEKVVSSNKAANFPFNRTVVKDCTEAFENQPTEAQLRTYATRLINKTGFGDPELQMDVSFEHLAEYEEYKLFGVDEQVNLGDTVYVNYPDLQLNASARVMGTNYDVLNEKYTGISLGKIKYDLNNVFDELRK